MEGVVVKGTRDGGEGDVAELVLNCKRILSSVNA